MAKNDYKLVQTVHEAQMHRARTNLLAFTMWTKPDYRVNWHHKVLCKYINRWIRGEIKHLMIFTPPRHGKSELVSRRLPALLLGRNPDTQIIAASYSDALASLMNRDTQRIIESEEYQDLFPQTRLGTSTMGYTRNSDAFEVVGRRGWYKSAGIGTGITGMGANYAIIDDPVKDQIDADSETKRKNAWEWYTSTLYTRLQAPRSVLLTMTRWHQDDLAGRLLKQAKEDPNADQWTVVCLPAVRTEAGDQEDGRQPGDALWPSDFGPEILNSIKASVGSRVWAALYQQSPRPDGGGLFRDSMFDFVDLRGKTISWDYQFIMGDTAYKDGQENDFTVFTAFGVAGGELYIRDVWRQKIKASEIERPAVNFITGFQSYGFRGAYIEPKGHGIYLNQVLPHRGIIMPSPSQIEEFFKDRKHDKVQRANNIIPYLSSRKIHINSNISCKDELLSEALNFPNDAHDDFVDTLIDGVKFAFSRSVGILDVV